MEWAIAVYLIIGVTTALYVASLWWRGRRLQQEREAWRQQPRAEE